MPLVKPTAKETEDDFISRCMGDDNMKSEFTDNDQRLAVCFSKFREVKKSKLIRKIEKSLDKIERLVLKEQAVVKQDARKRLGLLQSIENQMKTIFELKSKEYEKQFGGEVTDMSKTLEMPDFNERQSNMLTKCYCIARANGHSKKTSMGCAMQALNKEIIKNIDTMSMVSKAKVSDG